MLPAVQSLHQSAVRQKVHLGRVDKKLLDIIVYNHSQLFLGKYRLFDDRLQYVKRLGKVFIQRIKGDIGILGCTGQFQPGSVIVQLFRYLGGIVASGALAKHAVRKQRLQGLFLLPSAACHEEIDTCHFIVTGIEHAQWYAIRQLDTFRPLHHQLFRFENPGLVTSVQHGLSSLQPMAFKKFFCPFQILRSIYADSFHIRDTCFDSVSVFQPTKLFQ